MKKLYLTTWDYNKYLIIEELKKIIIKNNGFMVSDWKQKEEKTKIYNRNYLQKIEDNKKHIKFLEEQKKTELSKYKNNINKTIKKYQEDITELENNYKKSARIITNNGYLQFVFNGCLYYIQLHDNPFFDFYYYKQSINNDLIIEKYVYLDILPKENLFTKDFYDKYSKKNLQETAKNIYNYLIESKKSKTYDKYILPKKYYKIGG